MRNSPHPFHTQNTQKVALERTGELGSQGRVAWLLPKPEDASIFKDLKQARDQNSLFCPQPPGYLSQLCGNLMQMELGRSQRLFD